MTTMTMPDLDLDAIGAVVDAALAEPEDEVRIARRVKMHEAKDWFDAGGDVLVSEYGHKETYPVGRDSTVHNWRSTTWPALRTEVALWKGRYPNQRYYIVPTSKEKSLSGPRPEPTTHNPAVPKPVAAAPADEVPTFEMPRVECEPRIMEVITSAVEKVLTGNHKATVEKRKRLIAELAQGLADMRVYGIELDYARVAIGEPIILGNASIDVDGHGDASAIYVDGGTPIWDPQ